MKSSRLDYQQSPMLIPLSSADGIGDDKQKGRGNIKSKIPQYMSSATGRCRTFLKRAADTRTYEATRPKSATTRLPPTHPAQLLQDVRQTRPSKERPPLKRPSNLVKTTSPPFRPSTPVIKVPLSSEPTILPGRDDQDADGNSVCSNSNRCNESKRRASKTSDDKKRMLLKMRWQENMGKFENLKRQLHEKQQNILELYARLRTSHQKLSDLGQTMFLPPSEDLNIMNVAKLVPEQLLQLCMGAEVSEAINTNPPFDLHLLREIPNRIVTTCEKTLNSRKEIIDWFEDVMAKKMITKNVLVKKIKEFKTENEGFKKTLDKHKEEYSRFFKDTDDCLKMCADNDLSYQQQFHLFSYKLSEMNALNDDLKKKLLEMEKQVMAANNKSGELERQLMDEKNRKRDDIARADMQSKIKEEKIAQITQALKNAKSECTSLEKLVCQMRAENQQMQLSYDKKIKTLNESIEINMKLFDEITADRSRILDEKQDLERQLIELTKSFEETLSNIKHESNSTVADLIETQKKYKEALDEKNNMADKIESMCAQLLESELRYKEASIKLAEMESNSRNITECRKEIEMLNRHLENTKEEILEYKKIVTKQQETIQELRRNWNFALSSGEQLKNDLNSKETSILELEKQRTALEQALHDSELKTESYAEELSNLKNQIAPLQKVFGGFKTIEELLETIQQQTSNLLEANRQNDSLADALKNKNLELQQQVEQLAEQKQLLEERETALKVLTDKNEEQNNIIQLLRNNLDDRTRADIEINRQIDEKNNEIESLISNVEKRKQQISQLEKIILTLENQIAKLSDQKRTAREAILSLEKKLCEYESYYMANEKKTESSTENLDDLINILEYELTEPSEDQFNSLHQTLGIQNMAGSRNKRGARSGFNCPPDNNSDMYQSRKKEATRSGMGSYLNNTNVLNKNNHKGDGVSENKVLTNVSSTKKTATPKPTYLPKDYKSTILPIANQTTNVNYCLMPNSINDGKKLKMLKLAGHKLL